MLSNIGAVILNGTKNGTKILTKKQKKFKNYA